MSYHTEYQRRIIKVIEWKDGCVYRTKDLGSIWVHEDDCMDNDRSNAIAKQHGGNFLGSMPTGTSYEEFTRTVRDTT